MWTRKRSRAAGGHEHDTAIDDADRKLAESQARSQAAAEVVARARRARTVLHHEVAKNGWTELFLASMQRGG